MSREIVLNFHGLGIPHETVDASERPYWIDAETFAMIVGKAATLPHVSFTFDDGNQSDLEVAAPILRKHGLAGEFFLLTGRLGQEHYLSASGIQALIDLGMGVGLHGRDHVDWRDAGKEALLEETVVARDELAAISGQAIDAVSIPFGAYNRRIIDHLRRCGFAVIYTSDGGATRSGAQIRSRTSIRSDMSTARIDAILAGAWSAPDRARRALSTFSRRHLL